MAFLTIVRSYRNVLMALLVVSTLTTSCKKSGGSDPDIDPREQYVGTYDGDYRITIYIGSDGLTPDVGKINVAVTKASNPKEMYFDMSYDGNVKERVTAELNGDTFTIIDKKTDQITLTPTNRVNSDYAATGSFTSTQLLLNASANALRNGTQYSKKYDIIATRK